MSRTDRVVSVLLAVTSVVAMAMSLGNLVTGDQQWAMSWCALALSLVAVRRTI